MENDLLYRLALTRVKGIAATRTKTLIGHYGEAAAVFRAPLETLAKIPGIGQHRARAIKDFSGFSIAEKELRFLERYKIRPLFFTDPDYPRRLLRVKNVPALLFYKGNADLNAPRILAVVGTLTPTEYGKQVTDKLIKALARPDLLIVSGLAYGIDAAAHQAALHHAVSTIGVLGHGLDRIYPEQNTALARKMLEQGGLLTGFTTGTQPDEHNFPVRNRIVAAMSDALIVIETGSRGGSTLTVGNALACNKKVFALPGRITDNKSIGCNALIRQGKAQMLTDARQLLQEMQWGEGQANSSADTIRNADNTIRNAANTVRNTRASSNAHTAHRTRKTNITQHTGHSRNAGAAPDTRIPAARTSSFSPTSISNSNYGSLSSNDSALSSNDNLLSSGDSTLSNEEKKLLALLRETNGLSLDQLLGRNDLGGYRVSLTLLTLELQGLIRCLPGKRYAATY